MCHNNQKVIPPIKLKDFPKFSISIWNFTVELEVTLNLFFSRGKLTVYNNKRSSEVMAHVLRSHTCKDFDVKFLTEVISSAVPRETVVTKILKTEILGLQ